MFSSWVQFDFYWIGSIQVDYFRIQVYSGRFLLVSVLSDKRNLDPKGACKFPVRFRIEYF